MRQFRRILKKENIMPKRLFNNFWQALKRIFTRERLWKFLKVALALGRLIYRLIRLLEGEDA